MSKRKVKRLKLDPEITDRLIMQNIITAQDLLSCPVLALMEIVDMSYVDTVTLLSTVGATLIKPQTAQEALIRPLEYPNNCVSSGVFGASTDDIFGGFVIGTISEICGPPGIGKTQLCLGCCADVLLKQYQLDVSATTRDARHGGVVYYDTELKFSPQRLLEIIMSRNPETCQPSHGDTSISIAEELLQRVSVRRPMTCQQFKDDLLHLETHLITEGTALVLHN